MAHDIDPDDLDYDHAWRDCSRAPRYLVHITGAVLFRRRDGVLCGSHVLGPSPARREYLDARTLDGERRERLMLSPSAIWAASWGVEAGQPWRPPQCTGEAQAVLALFPDDPRGGVKSRDARRRGHDKRPRKRRGEVTCSL